MLSSEIHINKTLLKIDISQSNKDMTKAYTYCKQCSENTDHQGSLFFFYYYYHERNKLIIIKLLIRIL